MNLICLFIIDLLLIYCLLLLFVNGVINHAGLMPLAKLESNPSSWTGILIWEAVSERVFPQRSEMTLWSYAPVYFHTPDGFHNGNAQDTARPWTCFTSKLLTIAAIVCIVLISYRYTVFWLHADKIILRTRSGYIPSCEEQVAQFRANARRCSPYHTIIIFQ